jgi:hypothetical protein
VRWPPPAPPAAPTAAPAEAPPSDARASSRALDALDKSLVGGDPSALAAEVRELARTAPAAEKPFLERLEGLIRALAAGGGDVDATLRVAVQGLAQLEPLARHVDTRVGLAMRTHSMAIAATGSAGGEAADAIAVGMSQRLEGDFPDEPRALAVRASVMRRIEGDLAGALARARRCAGALPVCEKLVEALTAELGAPRCAGAELRAGFALHRGTAGGAHASAPRRLEVGGAPMWIAEAPAIAGSDVEEMVGDGGTLLITLTPGSRSKLDAFLSQSTESDAAAVIFTEGAARGVATRLVPMLRGKLLLTSDSRAPLRLEAVCARVRRGLADR